MKTIRILVVKFSVYLNRHAFIMQSYNFYTTFPKRPFDQLIIWAYSVEGILTDNEFKCFSQRWTCPCIRAVKKNIEINKKKCILLQNQESFEAESLYMYVHVASGTLDLKFIQTIILGMSNLRNFLWRRCWKIILLTYSWNWQIMIKVAKPITKTCLYIFYPLKPHFYIVKLGFTGVFIIFLISDQNIDCGYSLEPPRRGGSNEYPQSIFWAESWKISEFFIWKFSFFCW